MHVLNQGRIALFVVLFVSNVSLAQTITFTEAAQKTLAYRPEFKRFALSAAQLEQQRLQAGLKPALEFQSTLENVLGTGEVSGFNAAELTIGIGSRFEYADKRHARVGLIDAKGELLQAEQKIAALDVLAESARRFVALSRAQAFFALAESWENQAQETLEQAKRRLAAAAAPKTELLSAELLLSDAIRQRQKAQRSLNSAQRDLAQQWGQEAASTLQVKLDLFDLPTLEADERLQQRLLQTPDLLRFASAARIHQAERVLAKAQAKADWQWSVGVRALQGPTDQALVASFSIPLGNAGRAQYALREAELQREQVDLAQRIEQARIETSLRGLLQQLADAREAEQMIRTQQLPRAEELLQLIQQGLELGRYSTRDLAMVRAQWLSLQREHLESAAAFHLVRVEIERVTGAALNLLEAQ